MAPSAFHQANHKSLVRVDYLCRAAILRYKEDNGFKDNPERASPEGAVRTDVKIL